MDIPEGLPVRLICVGPLAVTEPVIDDEPAPAEADNAVQLSICALLMSDKVSILFFVLSRKLKNDTDSINNLIPENGNQCSISFDITESFSGNIRSIIFTKEENNKTKNQTYQQQSPLHFLHS